MAGLGGTDDRSGDHRLQRFYIHRQAKYGDRHVYAARTRFISDHILGSFEQVSWPAPSEQHGRVPQPDVRVDLKGRMRKMWL
jgi:DNA helicase-2/ATP-dependent DNA helicase PcrA